MREIRFRAWTDEEGYLNQDDLDGYSIHELRKGVLIDRPGEGDQMKIVLEQFTGLLDKNGKMIYEGDILGGIIGLPIHWCERSNAWQLKYPDDDLCACYRHEGDCELSDFEQNELEVIGTIHDAEYKELAK